MIFLTPEHEYSYPKDQACFNEKRIRKPVFGPQALIFIFSQNVEVQDNHEKIRKVMLHANISNPKTHENPKKVMSAVISPAQTTIRQITKTM